MRYFRALFIILFFTATAGFSPAFASHVVGGEITYKFIDSSDTGARYEVTLTLYEDILNGHADAIASDNPAKVNVYLGGTSTLVRSDDVFYTYVNDVPPNFKSDCVTNYPAVGIDKKTFVMIYVFPPSTSGYLISYQRCCRNEGITNIINPGNEGTTLTAFIPPNALAAHNTSAVFKNYPPLIICNSNPLTYDNSATDADGDSLSYELCNALTEHDKPNPPPFDSVEWLYPVYNYSTPITGYPPIVLNPVTGLMTGTPNRVGRYLVTICCHEWRNGLLISTIRREFQFIITDCSRVVVADIPQYSTQANTYILNCADYTVHFVNQSRGGSSYLWNFGAKRLQVNTSTEFEPTVTYPDTGIYTVRLIVNPGGDCQDSISRLVKIFPEFRVAFTDSGNFCPGLPLNFLDRSVVTVKPVTSWQWNFGDGAVSGEQNPIHSYEKGGTYNVVLTSENIKGCADTALSHVIVEAFHPYAGDDTIIVKGEHMQFNAQGGVRYAWFPPDHLGDTDVSAPIGFFPDTGLYHYTVRIVSAYGCTGEAGINVLVSDHASFFLPNAFSPNGDGLNDIFRAKAVGYSNLKYFKIFNRFGEMVYSGDNIEAGWDGTCNHHQADIGVYFWQIVYIDRFGKEGFVKGDVTLIR